MRVDSDSYAECYSCGFYDSDYGCTCSSLDAWYACSIESRKPENQQELLEYAEWLRDRKEIYHES